MNHINVYELLSNMQHITNILFNIIFVVLFYLFSIIHIKNKRKILIVSIIQFSLLIISDFLFPNITNYISHLIVFFLTYITMYILLPHTRLITLYVTIVFFSIRWLVSTIVAIIIVPIVHNGVFYLMGFVISSSNPNELNYHISTSIVMMLTTPFIHFCAMYFILMYYKRFSKWVDNEIDFKELILLICPSLIGITSYSLFVDIDGHFSESLVFQGSKSIYIWMIHNFIILSCILLFLFLYQRILNHRDVKRKEFILKSQLINIEEHVAHIKDKYDQLRILKHDITSHISTISSLVNINNYSEANQIINELQNTLNDQKYNYNTGNPITDVILFEQSERFENANIKFTNKFHYPANADFKAIDLCVILYNTLQNAYEATINFSNTWVELSSIYYKGTYIITVKNPIHAEIKFKRDGLIESSKANKTEHGIGLYSVREISNKYSGDVNIDIEDGIFTINIILKNENTTSSSSLQ